MTERAQSASSAANVAKPADADAPRKLGGSVGRWLRAIFWLCVGLAIVWLAVRSFKRTDVLAVFSRSGAIQALGSHRGRVVLVVSSLSFGREQALTAEHAVVTTKEGEDLYERAYKSWPGLRERYGFGIASSRRGDLPENATHTAFVVPHWALAALMGLPITFRLIGAFRWWRRRRRGWCLHCGYDLHGNTGVCPECGEPVKPARAARRALAAAGVKAAGRSAANALVTLALIGAIVVAARPSRAEPTPWPGGLSPAGVRAGLDRRVPDVISDNVALEDLVGFLGDVTGTKIEPDWSSLDRDHQASTPIGSIRLHDVNLDTALRIAFSGPTVAIGVRKDGVIAVWEGPPTFEADPYVVRAYDARALLASLPSRPISEEELFGQKKQQQNWCWPATIDEVRTTRDEAIDHLIDVLKSSSSIDDWDDDSAMWSNTLGPPNWPRLGRIYQHGGWIIIVQTEKVQRRLGQLLRDLGAPPAGWPSPSTTSTTAGSPTNVRRRRRCT